MKIGLCDLAGDGCLRTVRMICAGVDLEFLENLATEAVVGNHALDGTLHEALGVLGPDDCHVDFDLCHVPFFQVMRLAKREFKWVPLKSKSPASIQPAGLGKCRKLAFAELELFPRTRLAGLLSLLLARVTGEVTSFLERLA